MAGTAIKVIYLLIMVATVVTVDFLFLRGLFWERLVVNITIVLVFLGVYLKFLNS